MILRVVVIPLWIYALSKCHDVVAWVNCSCFCSVIHSIKMRFFFLNICISCPRLIHISVVSATEINSFFTWSRVTWLSCASSSNRGDKRYRKNGRNLKLYVGRHPFLPAVVHLGRNFFSLLIFLVLYKSVCIVKRAACVNSHLKIFVHLLHEKINKTYYNNEWISFHNCNILSSIPKFGRLTSKIEAYFASLIQWEFLLK